MAVQIYLDTNIRTALEWSEYFLELAYQHRGSGEGDKIDPLVFIPFKYTKTSVVEDVNDTYDTEGVIFEMSNAEFREWATRLDRNEWASQAMWDAEGEITQEFLDRFIEGRN